MASAGEAEAESGDSCAVALVRVDHVHPDLRVGEDDLVGRVH